MGYGESIHSTWTGQGIVLICRCVQFTYTQKCLTASLRNLMPASYFLANAIKDFKAPCAAFNSNLGFCSSVVSSCVMSLNQSFMFFFFSFVFLNVCGLQMVLWRKRTPEFSWHSNPFWKWRTSFTNYSRSLWRRYWTLYLSRFKSPWFR